MKEYNTQRNYETMHRNKYDWYRGNIRKKISTEINIYIVQTKKFFRSTLFKPTKMLQERVLLFVK